MAGQFTPYLAKKLLDHVFGGTAYTAPASLYVGLSTTTPTASGGNFTEPTGNGYSRVSVAQNTTKWPNATGSTNGQKENGEAVTFPTASGEGWGVVTHFGVFDAVSSGNLLVWGPLDSNKTIDPGDTPSFAAGTLDVSLT